MIAYLQAHFGGRLICANGGTYPVIFFPASESQCRVDSVLHEQPPAAHTMQSDYVIYDADHLASRLASRMMTNDLTFTMAHMEAANDRLRIVGSTASYFDMIATCDALDHELRDWVRGVREGTPLRNHLFAQVAPDDALYSGAGRAATIGISVLTVFAMHDRGYHALLVQRSNRLAIGAGLFHIMPAFVFQPVGQPEWQASMWSIEQQVLREFGEELFVMPEYDAWTAPTSPDYFTQFGPVAHLIAMLNDGRASLTLTGVAINLLSIRPEVCTLLIIHDPDWYATYEAQLAAAQHTERQATHYLPVDTLAGLPDRLHIRMVPHGGACLWNGLAKFRSLVG